MKTALFCGIFIIFLLVEIRSETTTGENKLSTGDTRPPNPGVGSDLTADVTHNTPPAFSVSSSTDQTAAAKTRTVSVAETENPTRVHTVSMSTTASDAKVGISAASTTQVKSAEERSTALPSTNITRETVTERILPSVSAKTKPQSMENTSGFPASPTTSTKTSTMMSSVSAGARRTTRTSDESDVFNQSSSSSAPVTRPSATNGVNTTEGTEHHSTIATEHHSTTATEHHSTIATEHHSTTATEHHSTTATEHHSTIATEHHSTTATEHHSTTATEHHSTTALPTSASSDTSSTNMTWTTNATQGGGIPVVTETLPGTTRPSAESTQTPEGQSCSSKLLASKCLIVVASLAAVATVSIISTTILCTKLSSRRYKARRRQEATEMTCISSLLSQRSKPGGHARRHGPVPNGVLVLHPCGDSDEETGDNLTLSSFLPDNDRYN